MNTGVYPLVVGFLRRQSVFLAVSEMAPPGGGMSVFFALHVHDDFYVIVMPVGMWALRNLPDGAVHVFSSCLVCFEELTNVLPKVCVISSPSTITLFLKHSIGPNTVPCVKTDF